jgi:hypothetical protein
MALRPRQFNFLAAFEAVHGQPDYVARQTLLEFVANHKDQKGPYGFVLRWPAWLTYNQPADRPFKSLRRGQFLMTEAWKEYNAWKASQSNSATSDPAPTPSPNGGEESNYGNDLSAQSEGTSQPIG